MSNLQLMTPKQNCQKSVKNRDYSFTANNHENKKCVKAYNCQTNEVSYYNSMYAIQQHLGINAGTVKIVCEGINNCKTDKNNQNYTFAYINREDLPADYKKSAKTFDQKCQMKKKRNTE